MYHHHTHKTESAQSTGEKTPGSKGAYLTDNRGLSNPVQRKANNTGLPDNLKSGIENLSGHSMDDVKVHYNSSAPAQLNAHAYAQGNQIHVAPGHEKHVPHEDWLVVPQKEGRVRTTMQMKGKVNVNDDRGLEKEADVMGAKAALGGISQLMPLKNTPSVSYPAGKGIAKLSDLSDARKEFGEHEDDFKHAKGVFDTEANALKGKANSMDAFGLEHWAKETKMGAVRHYNELSYLSKFKGEHHQLRLGTNNLWEPDLVGQSSTGSKGVVEIKTSHSLWNADISALAVAALTQAQSRKPFAGGWYAHVGLFIENAMNAWPWLGRTGDFGGDTAAFIKALKKQTSIKGHQASDYPDVAFVKFNIWYKGVGYKSYSINLNTDL